jgi:hypothetical protein
MEPRNLQTCSSQVATKWRATAAHHCTQPQSQCDHAFETPGRSMRRPEVGHMWCTLPYMYGVQLHVQLAAEPIMDHDLQWDLVGPAEQRAFAEY